MRQEIQNDFVEKFDKFYYQNKRQFCFYNEVINWIYLNYGLAISNSDIRDILINNGFVYRNKHIRFSDGSTKSDRIWYKETDLDLYTYPERSRMIKSSEIIKHYAKLILEDIRKDEVLNAELYNFNVYKEDGVDILLFDNENIKDYIDSKREIYNYDNANAKKIASFIRSNSSKNYIRKNIYTEKSSTVQDKLFYKYTYKEDI